QTYDPLRCTSSSRLHLFVSLFHLHHFQNGRDEGFRLCSSFGWLDSRRICCCSSTTAPPSTGVTFWLGCPGCCHSLRCGCCKLLNHAFELQREPLSLVSVQSLR